MKMKKGLGIFAVLLALTVVACNSTPSNANNNEEPASSELANETSKKQQKINVTTEDSKTLEVGDMIQLTADVSGVTWSSSDENVAEVDVDGIVTAVGYGSATIKASKEGYKDGSISITVKKPAAPHSIPTFPATCPDLIDTSSWTAGAAVKNSYGKDYIPLTGGDGSVGVKIAMTDYDPKSASTFDSDGKLATEADGYVKFAVKAPKAGIYQMILKASCSESGDDYPFAGESSRGFDVKVNDYEDQDNVYGTRLYSDAGLDHDEKREFIFALVYLNGPAYEDEIQFRNPYYRMKFDTSSYLIFAENK